MQVVYADMDGTILRREDYSFSESLDAIEALKAGGIPLVMCSSKTFDELYYYQEQWKMQVPFIAENGSVIAIPEDYFDFEFPFSFIEKEFRIIETGITTSIIQKEFDQVAKITGIPLQTFRDFSVAELKEITGLNGDEVKRAVNKNYSVTITTPMEEEKLNKLNSLLKDKNIVLIRGTRFITATGKMADKGKAVSLLSNFFRRHHGFLKTYAVGDGENDFPMFKACDRSFFVGELSNGFGDRFKGLNVVLEPGGFAEVIKEIMKEKPGNNASQGY